MGSACSRCGIGCLRGNGPCALRGIRGPRCVGHTPSGLAPTRGSTRGLGTVGAQHKTSPPLPLVLIRATFCFRGPECGNTWARCLDKPVLPRGTSRGTHIVTGRPAVKRGGVMTTEECPTGQQTLQNTGAQVRRLTCSDTSTSPPTLTPPAARTKLQTTVSIRFGPQKQWFQKRHKMCANTGV